MLVHVFGYQEEPTPVMIYLLFLLLELRHKLRTPSYGLRIDCILTSSWFKYYIYSNTELCDQPNNTHSLIFVMSTWSNSNDGSFRQRVVGG
jgi:hypothetical protein